jgi:hypothetical protein
VLVGDAYDLLDGPGKQVMQALAVFPAPVSAIGVDFLLRPVNPTTAAAPVLSRLVRRQLVRFHDGLYYLHPVDRDYARSQLPPGGPGDSPAGKEPRNFGLHRVKQLAGIPEVTDIIQLAPATPHPADRTWVLLTEVPKGGWGLGGHANTKRVVVGSDLKKSPAFGAFLCWRWRAGAGDKVA